MAEEIEDHRLATPDGTHLHLERHPARGLGTPRGSVVFMHGFAMHASLYRHVAVAFAKAGFEVTALDVRGHGTSEGRRGYVKRFTDFLDDLDVVLGWARARIPADAPVVVVAHSHGGLIALAHAVSGRPGVSALALAAPWLGLTMKVPAIKRAASPVLGTLWPTLALANGIKLADITRVPAVQDQLARDPLIHHVATARWFNESLAMHAHILANAGRLSIPTFIGIPAQDRIASVAATEAFVQAATKAGAPVEHKVYPESFHELFLDPERERAIADMVAWVDAKVGSGVVGRDKPRILSSP